MVYETMSNICHVMSSFIRMTYVGDFIVIFFLYKTLGLFSTPLDMILICVRLMKSQLWMGLNSISPLSVLEST